jgi:hypothetical protein
VIRSDGLAALGERLQDLEDLLMAVEVEVARLDARVLGARHRLIGDENGAENRSLGLKIVRRNTPAGTH